LIGRTFLFSFWTDFPLLFSSLERRDEVAVKEIPPLPFSLPNEAAVAFPFFFLSRKIFFPPPSLRGSLFFLLKSVRRWKTRTTPFARSENPPFPPFLFFKDGVSPISGHSPFFPLFFHGLEDENRERPATFPRTRCFPFTTDCAFFRTQMAEHLLWINRV